MAGDGPRDGREDATLIAETWRIVSEGIDWDCEVATLRRDRHLGCRLAMSGAIDWFFHHVPAGVILEEDCVPHPDFFPYCAELLERYRDDDRVMHISGDNSADLTWDGGDSYRFIRWPQPWGWASWSRAWRHYDDSLAAWTAATAGRGARRVLPDPVERAFWMPKLARLRDTGKPDSWAYRWLATNVRLGGLTIVPRTNLVANIGFGLGATHTHNSENPRADHRTAPILPLVHADAVRLDPTVDRAHLERVVNLARAERRVAERRSLRERSRRAAAPVRRLLGRMRRGRIGSAPG